jgi:hypothetical protein
MSENKVSPDIAQEPDGNRDSRDGESFPQKRGWSRDSSGEQVDGFPDNQWNDQLQQVHKKKAGEADNERPPVFDEITRQRPEVSQRGSERETGSFHKRNVYHHGGFGATAFSLLVFLLDNNSPGGYFSGYEHAGTKPYQNGPVRF